MEKIKLEEVAKLEVIKDGNLVAWSVPHNGALPDLGITKNAAKPFSVRVYYLDGRAMEEFPEA